MKLSTPLTNLTGIGPGLLYKLKRLDLNTVEDLIYHFPFRYDDFSNTTSALEAKIGEAVTLQGEIWSIQNIYTRSRKIITKAIFNDGSAPIELTWFNSSWLTKQIQTGERLQVSGKITKYKNKLSIMAPRWERIKNQESRIKKQETIHTGRLVPIYPETSGISSKWLRTKISSLLPKFLGETADPLPDEIRDGMLPLQDALQQIHFPKNQQEAEAAKERLSFNELFFIQLATLKKRLEWQKKKSVKPFKINQKKLENFISRLPFQLTSAQSRVIQEITQDLKNTQPMNRLLQGEVGSGKTVVAAAIIYLAYLNNVKSVLMAPTEILAFQHYETLSKLLGPYRAQIGIYTGSRKYTENKATRIKNQASKKLNFNPDIMVGTHALLSKKLSLEDVGLMVVDEQQRFGVEQRSLLRANARSPHFLTMTATPIPRTVALTLYGDLDLSIIDEVPVGRKIVRTHFVPSYKRIDAYQFIENHLKQGFQTYIITPLIEKSETLASVRAAKIEFERLKKEIFPNFRLGLLHGRLKSKEKEAVITDFKNHQVDILVSTSVVEVGVDVPNATIMVIEGAERFGLAELHQLRGRVGRGKEQSYAFLFTEQEIPQIIKRLKKIEKIYDGLKLAELDLKIRGSGEIFGTKQSGRWNLKIAHLSDLKLIEETREAAKKILTFSSNLDKYPKLKAKLSDLAAQVMPD